MKLVVNADIIISAYTADGEAPAKWFRGLETHSLIISPEIFAEAEEALRRDEFGLSTEEIRKRLLDILDRCDVARPKGDLSEYPFVEADQYLANLAKEVEADKILTDDKKLLKLKNAGETQLISRKKLAK